MTFGFRPVILAACVLLVLVVSGHTLGQSESFAALERCITIVGDSTARGTAVVEVPGHGFPVIQTDPFAYALDDALREADALHIGIYDYSVEAVGLTGERVYSVTAEYDFALRSPCRYVVIFPWLNELPAATDPAARVAAQDATIAALSRLVIAFRSASPAAHIVLLSYYSVPVTSLGQTIYAERIQPDNIASMNQRLFTDCAPEGALGMLGNLTCLDIDTPLRAAFPDPVAGGYTLDALTQPAFEAAGYTPLDEAGVGMLAAYWGDNPDGAIRGDNVHLNAAGKAALAEALLAALMPGDVDTFVVRP